MPWMIKRLPGLLTDWVQCFKQTWPRQLASCNRQQNEYKWGVCLWFGSARLICSDESVAVAKLKVASEKNTVAQEKHARHRLFPLNGSVLNRVGSGTAKLAAIARFSPTAIQINTHVPGIERHWNFRCDPSLLHWFELCITVAIALQHPCGIYLLFHRMLCGNKVHV